MKIKIIYCITTRVFLKISPTIVAFPGGFQEITHLIEERDWDNFIKTLTRKKASLSFIKSSLKSFLANKQFKLISNE